MGAFLSNLFIPLANLPGLYDLPEECSEGALKPSTFGFSNLVFLGGTYSWFLYFASNLISDGSELLLLFPSIAPIIGSLVLPVLGAVPDGAIILFSFLTSESKSEEAKKSAISVGIGTLAGSTIMLLTLPWFVSIYVTQGRVQPNSQVMSDNANMMLISCFPLLIVLISSSQNAILLSFFFCVFIFFCFLTVEFKKANHKKRELKTADTQYKAIKKGLVSLHSLIRTEIDMMEQFLPLNAEIRSYGSNDNADQDLEKGNPMRESSLDTVIKRFFVKYDRNRDNSIDLLEFHNLAQDLHLNVTAKEVRDLFFALDEDDSDTVDYQEIKKFIENHPGDDETQKQEQKEVLWLSAQHLLSGTILILLFSDPMVDILSTTGRAMGISSFYVAFFLAPLASNASEFIASYNYAKKMDPEMLTIALSTLQGAAIMNNTFCLSIFLGMIMYQDLEWSYTKEVVSLLFVQLIMFWISKNEQTMWRALFVLMLLPLSLFLVFLL
eukprot:maker-scaffold_21-snap-gene-5.29-mRNA-1 protein AED:0.01 eAED:0.01 QI:23/1/1/1/1/1/2/85/494